MKCAANCFMHTVRLLAILALGLTLSAQVHATEVVGTTAAKFGVTPGGAASYAVPIAISHGTMDLKPEIVL